MISQLRHHLINLLIIALHPARAVCIGLMAFPFLMSFTTWGFWAAVACMSYAIVSQFAVIYIQIHNQK
jgi:hypothetical protein